MRKSDRVRVPVFTLVLCGLLLPAVAQDDGHYWPQWRGPMGTGVAPDANPPVEWSETSNIRWKIALRGSGHSTPIVWGDRVFITAAIPYGDPLAPRYDTAAGTHDSLPVTRRHRFVVLAVSRRAGKIIWQRTLHTELPHVLASWRRQPRVHHRSRRDNARDESR